MRVLRSSAYRSPYTSPGLDPRDPDGPHNQPVTLVVREVDLTVPLAEADNEQKCTAAENGVFAVNETFDVPDNTAIQHATVLAERRRQRRKQREVNQSMLYYWDAMYLPRSTAHGIISGSMPIPLKAKEIEYVFELLAMHPKYDHQTLIAYDENGQRVTMKDGKIT